MATEWKEIKYFREDEFRPPGYEGDFTMSMGFLIKLDILRENVGSRMVIHENGGFALTGHAQNSLHYRGFAADLHIEGKFGDEPRDVVEQAILAYKWTQLSIGIYPFWKRPGLHLDDRTGLGLDKRVWFRDADGEYRYYPYEKFSTCIRDLIHHLSSVEAKVT